MIVDLVRDVIGNPLNTFPKVPFFEIVLRCPGPDDNVRDMNVCRGDNLSTCWQHPDAYYRRRQNVANVFRDQRRGPSRSPVARCFPLRCRLSNVSGPALAACQQVPVGSGWRIVVGAATSDTAHRPARLKGLAHFVPCTNPRRVAQPMDEAAHTHIDAHLGYQGLWRRSGNIKRLSFRREPHANKVHTVMFFFFG